MDLIKSIKEKVKNLNKKIVLPESEDERVIRAAAKIKEEGFAHIILLGNKEDILTRANSYGVDIQGVEIIDPKNYEGIDTFVDTFTEMRAKKGMTKEQAYEIMTNKNTFFAAMLVKQGLADGVVSGSNSPTADVLRAAIQVIGVQKGLKTVSSSFIMLTNTPEYGEEGKLIFADCAVIPDPTAEQLADIAISSVEKGRKVAGIKEPKVALLSFSSKGSAEDDSVLKVREAYNILKERNVDFDFDGELQLDAAIVPSVGASKAKGSTVAGKANVLIFPNLNAGNIGYKLVQRFAKAQALGPLIQGLNKPMHDLSRGCSVNDIVEVVAITASE